MNLVKTKRTNRSCFFLIVSFCFLLVSCGKDKRVAQDREVLEATEGGAAIVHLPDVYDDKLKKELPKTWNEMQKVFEDEDLIEEFFNKLPRISFRRHQNCPTFYTTVGYDSTAEDEGGSAAKYLFRLKDEQLWDGFMKQLKASGGCFRWIVEGDRMRVTSIMTFEIGKVNEVGDEMILADMTSHKSHDSLQFEEKLNSPDAKMMDPPRGCRGLSRRQFLDRSRFCYGGWSVGSHSRDQTSMPKVLAEFEIQLNRYFPDESLAKHEILQKHSELYSKVRAVYKTGSVYFAEGKVFKALGYRPDVFSTHYWSRNSDHIDAKALLVVSAATKLFEMKKVFIGLDRTEPAGGARILDEKTFEQQGPYEYDFSFRSLDELVIREMAKIGYGYVMKQWVELDFDAVDLSLDSDIE